MIRRLALIVPALALALTAAPGVALAADQDGAAGTIDSIDVLTPSADTSLQYHGRVSVKSGTRSAEYRWGGTSCGSRTLSSENINLLVQAARDGLEVVPRYQSGQAGAKCIVGFSVQNLAKGK